MFHTQLTWAKRKNLINKKSKCWNDLYRHNYWLDRQTQHRDPYVTRTDQKFTSNIHIPLSPKMDRLRSTTDYHMSILWIKNKTDNSPTFYLCQALNCVWLHVKLTRKLKVIVEFDCTFPAHKSVHWIIGKAATNVCRMNHIKNGTPNSHVSATSLSKSMQTYFTKKFNMALAYCQ